MIPLPWFMASMVAQFWLEVLTPNPETKDHPMSDAPKPAKPKLVIPGTANPAKPAFDFQGLMVEIAARGFQPIGLNDPSNQWDNRARPLRKRASKGG